MTTLTPIAIGGLGAARRPTRDRRVTTVTTKQHQEPLLPRVASGDEAATKGVLDRYGGLVWSLARRLAPSGADAEEAVQEIFVDVWRSAARFDPAVASEKTFIAMVARRRLIDRLRKRGRRPEQALDESAASVPAPAANTSAAEQSEEARAAFEAFSRLRPEQQQVLRLSIQSGMTHEEIAGALSMPLGTVKTHARRGLIKVRELLEKGTGARGEIGAAS